MRLCYTIISVNIFYTSVFHAVSVKGHGTRKFKHTKKNLNVKHIESLSLSAHSLFMGKKNIDWKKTHAFY